MSEVYKNRYVSTSFWTDPYILDRLDPIEKLLYLWLLTNDRSNIAGIYEISMKKISIESGIEKDNCDKILKRFVADNKLYLMDGWVMIYNVFKHQNYNKSMIIGVDKIISQLPKALTELQEFTTIYMQNYLRYCREPQQLDQAGDTLGTGSHIINRNININKNSESKSKNVNNYVDNLFETYFNRTATDAEKNECWGLVNLFGEKIVRKGFEAAKSYNVLNLKYVQGVCLKAKPEVNKAIKDFKDLSKVAAAISAGGSFST
jgi:hypothetical protein